jgi:beta-ureidopropionase / N-carbamoyl-L-amino-acid hydrolase
MPSLPLQRTWLLFGTWYGLKRVAKLAPLATSRSPPVNVIPGRAEFPVELRDLDPAKSDRMWKHIQAKFAEVDKAENVETRCNLLDHWEPAGSDPNLQAAIREAAKSLALDTKDLPSLAGQDAQEIARAAPMAMIFVPSKDGISHSPKEFTAWQDVANGTEVLYRSILLLDEQRNRK